MEKDYMQLDEIALYKQVCQRYGNDILVRLNNKKYLQELLNSDKDGLVSAFLLKMGENY